MGWGEEGTGGPLTDIDTSTCDIVSSCMQVPKNSLIAEEHRAMLPH